MSNDEECIRRMTATLRSAIEHERKDHRHDGDAVDAAVGALFDEPRSVTAENAKHRQPPAA
jgi:hypothetical protein